MLQLISRNGDANLSDATDATIFVNGDANSPANRYLALATTSEHPIIFATNQTEALGNQLINERMRISAEGQVSINDLAGTGNAYVCVDYAGQIYRSATVCN